MHFQMGKWRFSVWVNMTFLTYLTLIARGKVTGWKYVDVCYCVVKELELSSEYFGRYCKKLLNQILFYFFQAIQL